MDIESIDKAITYFENRKKQIQMHWERVLPRGTESPKPYQTEVDAIDVALAAFGKLKTDFQNVRGSTTVHLLKCWPEFFQAIVDETKTFEVRRNDRGYCVGDILVLAEFDPNTEKFTDRIVLRRVTYILDSFSPIEEGFVVLAIKPLN